MGLSSLFKPKAMISLVLTKENKDESNEDSEYSSFENRLDKLGYKLQKIKKHSKQVFKCNNLNAQSSVEECYAKLKKERCKAKKEKTCVPKVCSKSPDKECTADGDSLQIDDFSCGDQLTLTDESGDECEEKKEACEDEESVKCAEQEDENAEEEEDDECEKEQNKCNSQEEDEEVKDDKCTQVMTLEPGGSTYLVSQLEFDKKYNSKTAARCPSFSSSKAPINADKNVCNQVKRGSSKKKIAKNSSFVIPLVANKSTLSVSKSSKKSLKASGYDFQCVETDGNLTGLVSLTKPTLQTFTVRGSSGAEEESGSSKMSSVLSQEQNQSGSLPKPESFKKAKLYSKSRSKTAQNSCLSNVNEESLLKQNEFNIDSLASNSQQATSNTSQYPENKQQSIVYIVQTPPKRNLSNLPSEGTIHIDATKVFIHNGATSTIKSGSNIGTAQEKPVTLKRQKSSEREVVLSEISASLSDKSKVSFQQPEVTEFKSRENKQSILVGQNQVDRSRTSTNTLYDNSSKIIPSVSGVSSQTVIASNSDVKPIELRSSKASECDSFVSDCNLKKPSYDQFVSDCEVFYSNSGKKIIARRTPKYSSTSQSVETMESITGKDSVGGSKNSMGSSDRNPVPNEIESQILITNLSQSDASSIPVQVVQLSGSVFEKNGTSKVSPESSGLNGRRQMSATMQDSKECTRQRAESSIEVTTSTVLDNRKEKTGIPMEKSSYNVLSNIYDTTENLNNQKIISSRSNMKLKNDEYQRISKLSNSSKIKESGTSLESSKITNTSLKTVKSQEISETSQKDKTIAMFVDTTVELPRIRSKEYLVIHCNKCKEVCIAKIVEKKQSPPDIWFEN